MSLASLTTAKLKSITKLVKRKDSLLAKVAAVVRQIEDAVGLPEEKIEVSKTRKKRRKMSAASRAKIAAAQKKRWAATKASKTKSSAKGPF